ESAARPTRVGELVESDRRRAPYRRSRSRGRVSSRRLVTPGAGGGVSAATVGSRRRGSARRRQTADSAVVTTDARSRQSLVAEVVELQRDAEVGLAQRCDDRLQVVAFLGRHADLITLGLALDAFQ